MASLLDEQVLEPPKDLVTVLSHSGLFKEPIDFIPDGAC